jgi:hypothetical protein
MRWINLFLLLILLAVFSCSSGDWKQEDRIEGLKNGFFRVYIRIDYEQKDDESYEKKIKEEIAALAGKRCSMMMKNYITIKYKEKEKFERMMGLMDGILKTAKIRYSECFEKYCEAFVDFEAKEL